MSDIWILQDFLDKKEATMRVQISDWKLVVYKLEYEIDTTTNPVSVRTKDETIVWTFTPEELRLELEKLQWKIDTIKKFIDDSTTTKKWYNIFWF